MSMFEERVEHRRLECGIELAVMVIPGRSVAAMELRVLAGYALERPDCLGVAHVLDEAIVKGTAKRDGRALNDAFDVIGASHGSRAGREAAGFSCLCLPEFMEEAVDLHAEMLRTPTFPQDACAVAVELSRQALAALDDEPLDLARKLLSRQAYGEPLGRHVLGEPATLDRIGRDQVVEHWERFFAADRMLAAVAGPVEPDRVAELFERAFAGFTRSTADGDRRPELPVCFTPGRTHHAKELEQEQVVMCFPGAGVTDADHAVELVALGVLSGGMSGRLWTEVREKQGLAYWVSAWADYPRRGGMVHLGASTTPQNLDRTYATLLREINRLSEDLTADEVQRAIIGIVSQVQTRGDVTRSRASRLADDLFFYGRPVPLAEKVARVEAVTADDVRQYLAVHPRDRLSVVTLGPRDLQAE